MRFGRSSRSLPPERTPCPHCGRETKTSTDGVCAECWGRKREGAQLFAPYRRERGFVWEELDELLWTPHVLWVAGAVVVFVIGVVAALAR